MADKSAGDGKDTVPKGIRITELVHLPVCGRTVEIRRWSYQRSLEIAKFLYSMSSGIPDEVANDRVAVMKYFFEHGGDSFLQVARLSLSPADVGVANDEIDAADGYALIEAVFKLNDDAKILKNAYSLAGSFALGKAQGIPPQAAPPKAS